MRLLTLIFFLTIVLMHLTDAHAFPSSDGSLKPIQPKDALFETDENLMSYRFPDSQSRFFDYHFNAVISGNYGNFLIKEKNETLMAFGFELVKTNEKNPYGPMGFLILPNKGMELYLYNILGHTENNIQFGFSHTILNHGSNMKLIDLSKIQGRIVYSFTDFIVLNKNSLNLTMGAGVSMSGFQLFININTAVFKF